jgi:hypothetical protein
MWRIKTSSHTLFELEYICIWPHISLLVAIPQDEHLTHTLEDIAMKQDPMLQKGYEQVGRHESK